MAIELNLRPSELVNSAFQKQFIMCQTMQLIKKVSIH